MQILGLVGGVLLVYGIIPNPELYKYDHAFGLLLSLFYILYGGMKCLMVLVCNMSPSFHANFKETKYTKFNIDFFGILIRVVLVILIGFGTVRYATINAITTMSNIHIEDGVYIESSN